MKRLLILMVFLLIIGIVNAAVDVVETNKTELMEPGDVRVINFSVTNTGAGAVTVTFTHNVDLSDDDGSNINLTLPGPSSIAAGATQQFQIMADVPNSQDFDTYVGSVTASGSDGTSDSFQLTLDVQPIICDFGIVGSSLKLTITDPNDGEDFKPGDVLSIDADVRNQGTDDIDVEVEAFLFNDEDSVESVSSGIKNVDESETEDFKLSLSVPTDSRELGKDKNFRLYLKAFDEDNEALECTQQFIELDLDLKNKEVVIDKATSRIIPSSAVCGELASAQITVTNIGDDEIDRASISLSNTELRVNLRTDTFNIEEFSSEEENTVTRRLEFRIPEDAKEKTYQLEARVNFEGKTDTELLPLSVSGCRKSVFETAFGEVRIDLIDQELSLKQGKTSTIPVKITNTNSDRKTFKVYLSNIADFAESASVNTLILMPGQSLTSFLDIKIKENTEPAKYSGLVQVSLDGVVINSKAITFDIKEGEKGAPLSFVVIGIIGALLVIVVVLIGLKR